MRRVALAVFVSLGLVACGSSEEVTAAPAQAAPAAEAPAPTAPAPTAAPAAEAPAPTAAPTPTAEAAPAGDNATVCAAYYDRSLRDALRSAEEGAQQHPGLDVRSALGVGERSVFLEQCGHLAPEQVRCFTDYAATHREECIGFLLAPPPTFVVPPVNNLSLDDLRARVAALPPA